MSLRIEAEGEALVLTLDRKERRNAIDRALAKKLGEAVRAAGEDASVRGIVLAAAGDETFVAGGDLQEIRSAVEEGAGPAPVLEMYHDLEAIEAGPLPVIAAVQGDVYGGGCELLLLCDMAIVEAQAKLAFRHARMGLSPAWGGLTRLVERVGPLEASRLMFTAEPLRGEEAARIGLVNEVVPKGEAKARAVAMIRQIARGSREVIATQKRALLEIRKAMRKDAIERERAIFPELWAGPAHQAAIAAFFSARKRG